ELDLSDRYVDLVGEGLDLAVRIGRLEDSSLMARKIADVSMQALAAPRFLDDHGRPQTAADMADWPALCYIGTTRIDTWQFTAPDGASGAVAMTARMRANNGNVICDAAARGLGVALQPTFISACAVARGELEVVLPDHEWAQTTIYTVYPQTRHLSAKSRAFMDFVRGRIGPQPNWTELAGENRLTQRPV
ncbi:MAG: substrate binding domain-containing protein, partial [Pseudomonadota bacterium]